MDMENDENKHRDTDSSADLLDLSSHISIIEEGKLYGIDDIIQIYRTGVYEHEDVVEVFDISCLDSWALINDDEYI